MSKVYNTNYAATGVSTFPQVGQPLDVRLVVENLADLTVYDDSIPSYSYLGMIVSVVSDSISDNNGIWYKYKEDREVNHTLNWKKIPDSEASNIDWPDAPSDWQTKNYYLKYSETDGEKTPVWVEIETPQGSEFTFNVHEPYQELESGDGYSIKPDMSSSTEMTLSNVYGNTETADVVAVKDDSNTFHLMLNPQLRYIFYGGDSEGLLRVKLTIDPATHTMDINELPTGGIGIDWLISQGYVTTDPDDADLNWFNTPVDPDNNTLAPLSPQEYGSLTTLGTMTKYCYASKTGWLPSLLWTVTFEVTEEIISISMSINDIRRTTSE